MQQLTPKQIRELKALLATIGLEVKKPREPKPLVPAYKYPKPTVWQRRYGKQPGYPYQWSGIRSWYEGRLCPSNWPSDIAAHYANPAWYYVHWLPAHAWVQVRPHSMPKPMLRKLALPAPNYRIERI
jgi:hypothetical protein